jgi:hypothetical protein
MSLGGRVDEIDVQIEKLHRLILGASKKDPELAAGMATSVPISSVQNYIDEASASCESLLSHLKDILRSK